MIEATVKQEVTEVTLVMDLETAKAVKGLCSMGAVHIDAANRINVGKIDAEPYTFQPVYRALKEAGI